jgi:hypothetical protein
MVVNTNLFRTFLKSGDASEGGEPQARQATEASPPGVADGILKLLADKPQGTASLSDLIGIAGGSFDALLATIGALKQRQLVEETDGHVVLTAFGREIAGKIRTPPA